MLSKIKHITTRVGLFKDWYKLIFPFNRFIPKAQTLHLRNGIVVDVGDIFSSDLSFIMEIFARNSYNLERFSLPANAIVVDVGANIGAFTLAAKKQFPGAHIIAYEPSPRNCALLRHNVPFARIEQKAIAGRSGKMQMQTERTPTMFHFVAEGGEPVEALSLHDALRDIPNIDLLKVDIEGAEYDVFAHASPEVMGKIRSVVVEIHAPDTLVWFGDFFKRNGFKVERLPSQLLYAYKT